ncbi:hypothetical protein EAY64_01865 [Aquitalea palustris]|uniref:Uncharacterized protein n=1 Tax=Aquitalea palustris TaxID=2480983 RepID=A0A454JMY6_9NEIS|nr:hypothetical protein [Aquitalea palustris]RMD01611.1 hypothetical protein EAY64_01865 [Aquitalea palustris]
MRQLIVRLLSRRQPSVELDSASEGRLCAQFLPVLQDLRRQRLDAWQGDATNMLAARNEDSMNLYERACLYLEFGQWQKALSLLEAAAQRLHGHSPSAAAGLMRLTSQMRAADSAARELLA